MTFTAYESSRKSGSPVSLLLFRVGSGANSYFAYTNHSQSISHDDGSGLGLVEYEPIAIQHGKISNTGNLDKTRLEIRMPNKVGLAQYLKGTFPSRVVTCVIFSGHVNDPDAEYPAAWTGRILGANNQPPELVLTGELSITAMRRAGLRRHWQLGCPHLLYDQEDGSCKADIAAATVTGTVASATGATVTLNAGWNGAFAADKFQNGGRLEWDTVADGDHEIRTIRKVVGNVLTLNAPIRDLTVGMTVSVRLGCNHQKTDCAELHVETGTGNPNIVNYGGQTRIPLASPLGLRNNYF